MMIYNNSITIILTFILINILKNHEVQSFSKVAYLKKNIYSSGIYLSTEIFEEIQDIDNSNADNDILNKIPLELLNEKTIIVAENLEEDYDYSYDEDPYNDLFNLDKLLDTDDNKKTLAANTIIIDTEQKNISFIKANKKSKVELWNQFMLSELEGNSKENSKETELFITEMKDVVEQQRGIAIWSSKTDEEIQKDKKKSLASKGFVIPNYVNMIVNAVFLERICTLKEIKKQEEFAFGQYKKWMREQRKKLKKDPLPIVKNELIKKWLYRHPNSINSNAISNKSSRRFKTGMSIYLRRPPFAVFDEITDEFYPVPIKTSNSTSTVLNNMKKSMKPVSTGIKTSSTALSPLLTPSIVNWDKTPQELISSTTNPSFSNMNDQFIKSENNCNIILNTQEIFKIDDTSMYISNNCVDDYYVIL